jgi:EAL domain-containing protein (putative c-di-GMP-specific phosphodiesterase class I)
MQAGTILLVDDEPALLRAITRQLESAGHTVVAAHNGGEACARLADCPFDVVLSDIAMPSMSGIDLLRVVRQRDLDLPVILITGNPTLATAISALQLGALGYLCKPVNSEEMVATVGRAVQLRRLARLKREAMDYLSGVKNWIGDRAGLEVNFTNAMETLWMAFQPVVSWSEKRTIAFEGLVRSPHPNFRSPIALIAAAERLGKIHELGRRLRDMVALQAAQCPAGTDIFVNLHTLDLNDEELYNPHAPLSQVAQRTVLELTERASIDEIRDLPERIRRLRELGYRIAVDDLGAGYSGLTLFAQVHPEIVKIDMSLIRNVDRETTKERLVRAMVDLCAEMGVRTVCEGVETAAERDVLVGIGCDLFQGYLFARPDRPFPAAKF